MIRAESIKHQFWKLNFSTDPDGGINGLKTIDINQLDLNRHLSWAGYCKYQMDSNYFFCHINNNIVKQVTEVEIREYVFSIIQSLPNFLDDTKFCHRDLLENKLLKGLSSYFNRDKLLYIPTITQEQFNRDTLKCKFIYYQNCFVQITQSGIESKDYADLSGYIWESEIIQRDFYPSKMLKSSEVAEFFQYVSGKHGFTGDFIQLENRFEALKKITGYLLHNYYDYKLKAILLTDSSITEQNEANGRTGKTLYCRLIAHTLSTNPADPSIKTFCELNGKDFDPANDKKYQGLSIETKLTHINDVKRYFDADSLYNDITDGLTVNRKFRDPFKINVKLIISTNKTIKLDGESSKDRFIEFQFSDFFSSKRTPERIFKHWFFRDWTKAQWQQYDLFMQSCCHSWISSLELEQPDNINLSERKLIEQTHPDFVDFLDELNPAGKWYSTENLYNQFCDTYPELRSDKRFNIIRFKKWIVTWCNLRPGYIPYNKKTHDDRREGVRGVIFKIIE